VIDLLPKCQDHKKLKEAIAATFLNRKTPVPESFQSAIKKIDTVILKAAWGGILTDSKVKFDDAWEQLGSLFAPKNESRKT
jgi:hypothetical protein